MRIKVRLFAILRERAGWRERDLDLPAGASIEDAWQHIVSVEPGARAVARVDPFCAQSLATPPPTSCSPTATSWC